MNSIHIEKLAAEAYTAHANTVVDGLKSLGCDHMTSGNDSPYSCVWEEFAAQIQEGESVFWDAYEEVARQFCRKEVAQMSVVERKLLWFFTEPGQEWTWDIDYDAEHGIERDPAREESASFDPEDVIDALYQRVVRIATDVELPSEAEDVEEEAEEDDSTPAPSHISDEELLLPLFDTPVMPGEA